VVVEEEAAPPTPPPVRCELEDAAASLMIK